MGRMGKRRTNRRWSPKAARQRRTPKQRSRRLTRKSDFKTWRSATSNYQQDPDDIVP
jgi:hypothetical protein